MTEVFANKYRHFKTGNFYKILCLARDSETLEEMIIYQGQYDSKEFGSNPIWARSKKDFFAMVVLNGKEVPRFEAIDN